MRMNALPEGNWLLPDKPRIAPLAPAQQTLVQRFFLRLTRRGARVRENLNVFLYLARLGSIFPRYLFFLSHLLKKGRIPPADKERIILRIAWRLGCVYEWGHHSHMAQRLGVSVGEIESIARIDTENWDDRLRTFIAAADELIDQHSLTEATWERLSKELSDDQLVEFCMLVGHYVMVAGLINSAGIRLEPGYLESVP